ncbi:uncharacterized protein LOC122154143 [Tyto alba]|uniref:uncharacterized protein LOC122154143 n=1 Tax=Tyto alba TaxID=56313 RepID=UPI001C6765FF|nr:uncharacterized protein LOC122154143 [Tyto alba]
MQQCDNTMMRISQTASEPLYIEPLAGRPAEAAAAGCLCNKRRQRRVAAPGELLEGAMEHRRAAGVRKAEARLNTRGERGELGHRRQHLERGGRPRLLDPELLDLPLGVKIPVPRGSRPLFSRGKLGEKLHRPSCTFNLGDPYCRLLSTEYNCLHDPHLEAYHRRSHNFRSLKRAGYVTSDGKVICNLKEFNEYRQYLSTLKLEAKKMSRQAEGRLQQHLPELKDAPKVPGAVDTSRLAERLLQPRKTSCPPQPRSRKVSLRSRRQTCSQPEQGEEGAKPPRRLSSDADSERIPPGILANGVFEAAFEQQTAGGAQKLEELSETAVQQVLETVNLPKREPQPSQTPFSRLHLEEGEGFPGASEQQSLEASKGAKLPVLPPLPNAAAAEVSQLCHTIVRESIQRAISRVQQRHAERTGYGRTVVPEVLGTGKKKLEMKPMPTALATSLAPRTIPDDSVDTVLVWTCAPGLH